MKKIFLENAPGVPFTLSSTMFLENETFEPACPYRVRYEDETFETQWELVATLHSGILVEFNARIDRVISGKVEFTLENGVNQVDIPSRDYTMYPLLDRMNVVCFLQDPSKYFKIPINFISPIQIRRLGIARGTLAFHGKHPDHQLGVHAFLDVKAYHKCWHLDLNFHNAFFPAGHFYFESLVLQLPIGFGFKEVLPYGTSETEEGEEAVIGHGNHMIPQRRQLSRRLVVGKKEDLESYDPFMGQGFSSFFNGGYLVQSFPVGHIKNSEDKVTADHVKELQKFVDNQSIFSGGPVVPNRLWISSDVPYQGMTGGTNIEQVTDCHVADAKMQIGLKTAMIRQLRFRNRQMGAILWKNGEPVSPEAYLNPDGSTPWQMYSNAFQKAAGKVQDAPFNYSTAKSNQGSCDYESALLSWQPIDHQHLKRITRDNQSLIWLMNDQLSKLYLMQDTELQKMAYWTGKKGRFYLSGANYADGMEPGREFAWILDCVSTAAACDYDPARKDRTKKYVESVLKYAFSHQLDTGWLNSRKSGKVVTDPPFNGEYWGGQSYESCFIATALLGAYQATGREEAIELLTGLLKAFRQYAWHPTNKFGPFYFVPTHKKMGANAWEILSKIPEEYKDGKIERYNAGVLPGIAHQVELLTGEYLDSAQWFLDYTGKPDFQSALAEIEKAQTGDADTTVHMANTIALAQKNIGGLFE